MRLLNRDEAETRVVGGAVRNALLDRPVDEVDLATTLKPEAVIERAGEAGLKSVPTGIEHGTVTLVIAGHSYEVTTLRSDVETDGRHATVAFGTDWQADAERRDLTINALYADADGAVIDPVGGLADLAAGTVRFIGDPETRIAEDYLRILRFFRFFAWYGSGRPEPEGLKACAREKDQIARLSAERVWSETRKLLAAPDPGRALLWMRQSGVLTAVLPETEKWGIDSVPAMVGTEKAFKWNPDALLRLMAIVPPETERLDALAKRLKLSRAEADRLEDWAEAPQVPYDIKDAAFDRLLYANKPPAVIDRLKLQLASARGRAITDSKAMVEAAAMSRLIERAKKWRRPSMPLGGADLKEQGVEEGPRMGRILARLEAAWLDSDFRLDRDALLERLPEAIGSE
ncbi:CCA tRNA nucleotidyltransferase [Pararhizobium mangrovi]|nr:CCA tRNA nucleotidyltransferase [Pararhizobium mangrovi]